MRIRLPALICVLASGACVSEQPVLGEHRLPAVEDLADAVLWLPDDTSFGERVVDVAGDLDGDDIDDLIVYAPDSPALYIHYGTTTWERELLLGGCSIRFAVGIVVSSAGDVDGDGRSDLLVSEPSNCRAYLVHGSEAPLCDAAPSTEITTSCTGRTTAHGIGDVDGDGLADFAVAPMTGEVALFYGRGSRFPDRLSEADADATFVAGTGDSEFGFHVGPGGNVDGGRDVKSEFFITSIHASLLYRSGSARFSGLIAVDRAAARFADDSIGLHRPVGLGDLDQDGRGDFAINGFTSLHSVYYGREEIYGSADSDLIGTHPGDSGAIRTGDLNGDGALDIAVSEPVLEVGSEGVAGGLHLLFGTTERLSSSVVLLETAVTWVSRDDRPGTPSIATGDIDGDGVGELVVAAPNSDRVYLVLDPGAAARGSSRGR